jgi:hypothetical protein
MDEDFLHFVWKHQMFNATVFQATGSERITVLKPGLHNHDSGPDFLQGMVDIAGIRNAGSIEIHLKSSDWYLHNHQFDPLYDQVVLHVVWKYNKAVFRRDGSEIPTIEIEPYVRKDVLQNYRSFQSHFQEPIPCSSQIDQVRSIILSLQINDQLQKRFFRKSLSMRIDLQSGLTWNDLAIRQIIRVFGFKTNKQPFSWLAEKLDLKIHKLLTSNPKGQAALIFGTAGLLEGRAINNEEGLFKDNLKKEYEFLKHKHRYDFIYPIWKYHCTRPQNFPTIRIAQLNEIIKQPGKVMEGIHHLYTIDLWEKFLIKELPDFWNHHFHLNRKSCDKVGHKLGKPAAHLVIINAIAPIAYLYGQIHGNEKMVAYAYELLETLKWESNKFTKSLKQIGFPAKNAADSQGSMELYNELCSKHQCLNCSVGHEILTRKQPKHIDQQKITEVRPAHH